MPFNKTFSLRIFFVLLLCSSILLLTVLLSFKFYTSITASIREGNSISTRYAAKAVGQSILVMLGPAASSLTMLGSTDITQTETHADRLHFLPHMASVLKGGSMIEAVFVGYRTGDFFYLRRFSEALNQKYRDETIPPQTAFLLLSRASRADKSFSHEMWYLDAGFNKLTQRQNTNPIVDPRERNWFNIAVQSKGIVSTRPYLFFGTNELGLTMARSVDQGKAVVGVDILTTDLHRTLADLRTTAGTEIAIVDSVNEVMAFTAPLKPLPEHLGPDGSITVEALGIPAFNHMLNAPVAPNNILTYKGEGDTWFGSVAALGEFYGNPLRLFITIPGSELLHKAKQQRETLLFFIVGTFVVFLAGGALLANWMFTPIRRVIDHLALLSEFNFTTPLCVDTFFTEIAQLGDALNNMSRSLHAFQQIMSILNSERDQRTMLNALLRYTLDIVRLEGGAIYLYENKTLNLTTHAGLPPEKLVIVIENADLPEEDLVVMLQERLGDQYVHVTLRNATGGLLGTLCVDQRTGIAQSKPYEKQILLRYLKKIAAAAAVGIETRQLIAAQKDLLDGMIELIARGIDAKSSHTWGHCNRVPELSLMLAHAARASQEPPFDNFTFTPEQQEEFRIAAWLHDCGKLTTPEHIVDKATKLETIHNRLHEIRTRFEVLHRDATLRCLTSILEGRDEATARVACRTEHEQLYKDFAFVAHCNIGTEFMDESSVQRLRAISEKTWLRHFDDSLGLSRDELQRCASDVKKSLPVEERLLADKDSHIIPWSDERIPPVRKNDPKNTLSFDMQLPPHMYNNGELHNLSIQRGTLTPEERFKINDHIVQTLSMLHSLPWPGHLQRVPDIAGNHHETLNGNGYPRKLGENELGIPERIVAIADVFEALTAPDRPYKEAKKLSEALNILAAMVKKRHLDRNVFALFLRSGIYLEYAKKYMIPELIDPISVEIYLQKSMPEEA